MRRTWEGYYQIKSDYDIRFSEQDISGKSVWLIFFDKFRRGHALFLKVNYLDGTYESRTVTFPFEPEIQEVVAAKDGLYFQGSYENQYIIAFSSFDEQYVRVLPYISQRNVNLCGFGLDTAGLELSVATSVKTGFRKERSTLRSYRNGYFTGQARTLGEPNSPRQPFYLFRSRFQDSAWSGTWTSPTWNFPQGYSQMQNGKVRYLTHFVDDTTFRALFNKPRQKRLANLKSGEKKDRFLQYRYYCNPVPSTGGTTLLMESFSERNLSAYTLPGIASNPVGPAVRAYFFDKVLLSRFSPEGNLLGTAAINLPDITSPDLHSQAALAGDTLLLVRKGTACLFANPYRPDAGWRQYPPALLGLPEDATPEVDTMVQEGPYVYVWGTLEGRERKYFICRVRE